MLSYKLIYISKYLANEASFLLENLPLIAILKNIENIIRLLCFR